MRLIQAQTALEQSETAKQAAQDRIGALAPELAQLKTDPGSQIDASSPTKEDFGKQSALKCWAAVLVSVELLSF